MRALVTGGAGFIGSALCEALLAAGHHVVAVDSLSDFYSPAQKRLNIAQLDTTPSFTFVHADLASAPLEFVEPSIDVVFHQAAQPGVRGSWGDRFATYTQDNVNATQRLLEATRDAGIERFVYASSSSVYGRSSTDPTAETELPHPNSPYGVTKLAGEHLCGVYALNFGLKTVSLRYFTVYGPRQRPDMAIERLISAATTGAAFPLYGDGHQVRDFTFVSDVVRANVLASQADIPPGSVFNIAGGAQTTMLELIASVERLTGGSIALDHRGAVPGDVARTAGDTTLARTMLGWEPLIPLVEGLERQIRAARTAVS